MDEQAKISDLTVAEFRTLMQQCFDADRKVVQDRKNAEWAEQQRRLMGLQTRPHPQEQSLSQFTPGIGLGFFGL